MPIKFRFKDLDKGAWLLLRQVPNLVSRCEDLVFSKYGLTTERHAVLMAIRHIDGPVRPTDVARWLDLSVNSVSMIIDRMVKAGLVKRVRDRKDRRTVFLTITSKAEKAYVVASVAGWELIQEILAPLSDKDKRTFIKLLETLRDKTYDYLGSGEVAEEVKRSEMENMAQLMKQAAKYESLSTLEAKRQGSRKKKTI
ncbi:MAG: MarR family transcriptional regulator [Dehalococcoidia bacterium]|nr:MarR family transcriptional regulator [Dehalococcoidia bacterium]